MAGEDLTTQFAGKVVAITGGTQGVGEAVARLIARRGAAGIAICGRNRERGEAVVRDLGGETLFVRADLENMDEARGFIDQTEAAFGRLDALVNCAAATDRGTLETTTEAIWDKLFTANVKSQFFLIQRAVAVMKKHGIEGAIANIGTMVAHGGPPFLVAYSSSKAALMTMTRALANDLRKDRIRINTLNIGWTNTPREHVVQTEVHHRPENWLEIASLGQPFGRLIETDEIARAIAFLASDESGLMTGANIDFDQTVVGTMDENPGV
jgi:NAD(P)-dependent dehydrogenase (short-subunit alcohol dehydrogenase family)